MNAPLDVRIVGNLSPPDWWTIGLTAGAAIVAAIIGAGVAYVVGRQSSKKQREARLAARRELEEVATLRLIVKLMQLINATAGIHNGLKEGIAKARTQLKEPDAPLWKCMQSHTGRVDDVRIVADDLVAFIRAREFDYISKLLFFNSLFVSATAGLDEYSTKRDQLLKMMTPDSMDGLIGHLELSEEEFKRLLPYVMTVEDMAKQALARISELFEYGQSIIPDFGPKIRAYFNDPTFPTIGVATPVVAQTADEPQAIP